MSNRRVKDIAYDDDDLDDYDDEYDDAGETEELSAEDQEQMRQGKIKVREALDSAISVSDREIEDALWNYYYDVAKSVSYLKNTKTPAKPTKPKPKQPSKFDQAAKAAAAKGTSPPSVSQFSQTTHAAPCTGPKEPKLPDTLAEPVSFPFPSLPAPPMSAKEFFSDTPWLKVPQHRLGIITVQSKYPKGVLLGGSSKPSKLAALAAKKKKPTAATDSTASPLGGLKYGTKPSSEASPSPSATPTTPACEENVRPTRSYPVQVRQREPRRPPPEEPVKKPEPIHSREESRPLVKAKPSQFGVVLCGDSFHSSRPDSGPATSSMTAISLANHPEYAEQNPFAGPSPDDVVANAQSKGYKGNKTKEKSSTKKGANDVAEGVGSLVVEESTRVKSKNLDVVAEFQNSKRKKSANFVVIGHVDHGKSTLMGRLLYDLKVVDTREVDSLRQEAETMGKSSFALAWLMDETSEERQHGVTVDIARNKFETDTTRFTILDAPGHRDFIPNMIAGASQADFAVLVTDAGTDAFESGLKGQTKEHALLVRSMGIQKLVVAINKMDSIAWSEDRFTEISQQMMAFLSTAGFDQKVAFIPCAGLTGENVTTPPEGSKMPWYTGPTLLVELDHFDPASRALEGPLRMTIDDVFRDSVTNPVSVSGRLESGTVQVGDTVVAMPSGETAAVKGIDADNAPNDETAVAGGSGTADFAVAGQIATLHLVNIDEVHLRGGDVICSAQSPIQSTRSFTAKLLCFDFVMPGFVSVHRGRLDAEGRVTKLVALLDKTSGTVTKKKPRIIKPGEVARVEVELVEGALPLEVPNRIVLRSEGQTLAAGMLEKAAA